MDGVAKKTRTDAWGEDFTENVKWALYDLTKAPSEEEKAEGRPWLRDFRKDVVPWLESHGMAVPGQSSWYRFLGRMRCAERIRLVEQVASSAKTAGDVARAVVDDATAAEAYKGLSVDAAMAGDADAAALYARASAVFGERAAKGRELDLKEAAQRTRDEQLRLAREKFEAAEARLAAVRDACEGAKAAPGGLTAETLRKIEEAAGLL